MPTSSSSLSADLGLKDLTLKDEEAVCQKGLMRLLEEGKITQLGSWLSSHYTSSGWWPGILVLPPLDWEQGARITPACILESAETDFSLNCLLSDSTTRLCPDCIIFPRLLWTVLWYFVWHQDFSALSLLTDWSWTLLLCSCLKPQSEIFRHWLCY